MTSKKEFRTFYQTSFLCFIADPILRKILSSTLKNFVYEEESLRSRKTSINSTELYIFHFSYFWDSNIYIYIYMCRCDYLLFRTYQMLDWQKIDNNSNPHKIHIHDRYKEIKLFWRTRANGKLCVGFTGTFLLIK